MSLVEAAAALDRLLRGHQEGGAPPNVPPYAPPSPALDALDGGNLLPTFFPEALTPEAILSSVSTEAPLSRILPWENLPTCTVEEEPLTPFHPTFSPLSSPIPVPTTLPTLPPPLCSPHWVRSVDETSGGEFATQEEIPLRSARTTDDISRRRKKRRSSRAYSESAVTSAAYLDEDDEFVPLDPEKYKTELCRSYQVHGNCRYGTRCNYAHGLQELRGAFRHGKYKTRNCQSYHQTGFCRYGARCSFIHDPEEGVLKCSIANKEVLEALHYWPSSDDSPRTANITWRILETAGDTIPELHFISTTSPMGDQHSIHNSTDTLEDIVYSHSPLQRQINVLINSNDALDESRLLTCTIPFREDVSSVFNSTLLLQENLDLLRSLQTGNDSNKIEPLPMTKSGSCTSLPFLDSADLFDQNRMPRNSSDEFGQRLPIFENSNLVSLTLSPIRPATVRELDSEVEICNKDPEEHKDLVPVKNIYQELKDLEVVHTILQKAPLYSSTVWSDGTDIPKIDLPKSTADASTQPTGDTESLNENITGATHEVKECNLMKGEGAKSKRKIKNTYRRRRLLGQKYSREDNETMFTNRSSKAQILKNDVFLSNSEEENSDLEVSTGATGTDGDDWSEKSSLHLADLLRSLQLREGNNHLIPWSKSGGRRCSSDGSSGGLLSVKDPPSSQSSPASPRQHDMTKYKTELCRSFQYNGYCSYGDSCLYAHGEVDLRSYPEHPMYRTKQCFSFHNKGFCLYGSRCQFLHDLE